MAGIAAVEAILNVDTGAQVKLVNEEAHPFYSRPGLAYYLAGEVSRSFLFPRSPLPDHAYPTLHGRVVHIDSKNHQVALMDGQRLTYDRLLIATGSSAIPLKIPGADLPGVMKLDTMDDASHLLAAGHGARSAVVIGGGITALEIAEGLSAHKIKVHFFIRSGRYWNAVLDEVEARIVEKRLTKEGIQLHFNTEAAEILSKNGAIDAVRTHQGEKVPCQVVAAAIGVRPRMELAVNAGLKTERGIVVNEWMQTSADDIYAAGDVAQVWDPASGRAVLDTLWWSARQQGELAGRNMAGGSIPYTRRPAINVTRLAGLTTTIIGQVALEGRDGEIQIARGDSESWQSVPDAIVAQDGFDVNHIRLMVGERTIKGAVIMGDQTLSRAVYRLISEQIDITSMRATLLNPTSRVAEALAQFWTEWQAHNAAE